MKKNIFSLIILLAVSIIAAAQSKEEFPAVMLERIKKINSDTSSCEKKSLRNQSNAEDEFTSRSYDNFDLTGYYKNNKLIKLFIERTQSSAFYSSSEYYFQDGKLFLIREKESYYPVNDSLPVSTQQIVSYEGKYYFDADKFFELKSYGEKNKVDPMWNDNSMVKKDLYFLHVADKYSELLSK